MSTAGARAADFASKPTSPEREEMAHEDSGATYQYVAVNLNRAEKVSEGQ